MNTKNSSVLNKYVKQLSKDFKPVNEDKIEVVNTLLFQSIDIARAINLLIEEDFDYQAVVLFRSLGEVVLMLVVLCSLKPKSREGYSAVYELHGWYEAVAIFKKDGRYEKSDYKKYKPKIVKRMDLLKETVMEEFNEDGKPRDHAQMRDFVTKKINTWIYDDAKILADGMYKKLPLVQKSINKLLKEGASYQNESHFVHSRFFASYMVAKDSMKHKKSVGRIIERDVVERLHLAMSVYTVHMGKSDSLMRKLTSIKRGEVGI